VAVAIKGTAQAYGHSNTHDKYQSPSPVFSDSIRSPSGESVPFKAMYGQEKGHLVEGHRDDSCDISLKADIIESRQVRTALWGGFSDNRRLYMCDVTGSRGGSGRKRTLKAWTHLCRHFVPLVAHFPSPLLFAAPRAASALAAWGEAGQGGDGGVDLKSVLRP
jgi:hypothetical protein